MRILITNIGIENRTGTEVVAMDLARGLAAAGHSPMIWAPKLRASLVEDLISGGIPVVAKLSALPHAPDVIHAHHHQETIEALRYFPGIPAIFVSHSGFGWHDSPPRHAAIRRFAGVDRLCCQRLQRTPWVAPHRIALVPNAVDFERFRPRDPLPPHPSSAVIFSNNAAPGTHLEPVAEACLELGIPLDCVGSGSGNQSVDPERLLPRYDLVFAKARCALEALAVGCAVVLVDTSGLGSMVTSVNAGEFRPWNFGFGLLSRPLRPDLIAAEIRRYDSGDAARASAYVRRHAGLEAAVSQYLSLYREAIDDPRDAGPAADAYPATRRLETEDQAGLSLVFQQFPNRVSAGRQFQLEVALDNRTRVPVATAAPWPSFLVYRWIHRETGEVLSEIESRSIVDPACMPDSSFVYRMRVAAPAREGVHILRVTLIQEGWRWLDALEPKVCAEALVSVTSAEFWPPLSGLPGSRTVGDHDAR